jgi:hypothetical protein
VAFTSFFIRLLPCRLYALLEQSHASRHSYDPCTDLTHEGNINVATDNALMPTSIMTTPGLTIAAIIVLACPALLLLDAAQARRKEH